MDSTYIYKKKNYQFFIVYLVTQNYICTKTQPHSKYHMHYSQKYLCGPPK